MKRVRFKDYLKDYLEYSNITNKDFANRIGITPKHLCDILAGNVNISADIVNKISIVTDIPIDYIYDIELNYMFENEIENYLKLNEYTETEYLKKFNYNYLIKSKFIDFIDTSDKLEIIKDILKFLRVSSPERVYDIDKTAYYKSKNDKPELLLLWLEKCYRETLKQNVKEYKKENINILVQYVIEMAKNDKFDEKAITNMFNENGVYFVIQDDIPGSKIRGAFKVNRDIPAIYLTHKYKRIADVYFAMLHELAHCKTDFNRAQATNMVSYDGRIDELEEKADAQAYDWMVDNKYYDTICKNQDYNIEEEKEYPKSFVAYRLAKDGKIRYNSKVYQKYNVLLDELKH